VGSVEAVMRNWLQGDCSVDGVSLRYFRSGGSLPPLVLVHGFTDNALYYSRLAEELATSWDVIAYDCRGHGQSDRAGGHFADADRVADLIGVVDQLDIRGAAMIGHSMGGATIARAVADHPGLSRGIVLEDPAWWEIPVANAAEAEARTIAKDVRNTEWRESLIAMKTQTREERLALRRADSPDWAERDVELSVDSRLEVELDLFTYFPPEESIWRPLVPRFDCPCLLVIGENSLGGIISVDAAKEAAGYNPKLTWVQVAGAGHAIRYSRFDAFLAATIPFLATLQPS
jgi:N-formylmaleamate deformylase